LTNVKGTLRFGTPLPGIENYKVVPSYAESTIVPVKLEQTVPQSSTKRSPMAIELPEFKAAEQPKFDTVVIKDQFVSALKMAFLGVGQGGGRVAQAFHDLGYVRVCALNTTDQDLASLSIPNKLVIGKDRGGAGKDPEQGRLAAEESFEDIMEMLLRVYGQDVEQAFLCVGAGGGSGTGSWSVALRALKEYLSTTQIESTTERKVGVIMTMPKRSEGARVQANALKALEEAIELCDRGDIKTLILVDNAKIHSILPGLSVKNFWKVANQNFASVLHTFNILAAQNSEYSTFDRSDFRSILRNGILIFGMTSVEKWDSKEDISKAIRQNLAGTLLADGFDLTKADMAGAIIVAHDDVLAELPMEHLDSAFHSLGRIIGNEGITLHNGVYESANSGMKVFTMISGLEPPAARLQELKQLSANVDTK
jgi:cell division GTPase FtsZ